MSYLSKVVYTFLRVARFSRIIESKMLRNTLNKFPVEPGKRLCRRTRVVRLIISGRSVWEISTKDYQSDTLIVFLHGGAYVANITRMHWNLIENLVEKTKATLIVPDYPLAPESTWKSAYEFMDKLYSFLVENYLGKKIVFVGDSAGGGLALGFAQKLRDERREIPKHLVILSPWLDLCMEDPDLETYERRDVILTLRGLRACAKNYAGNTNLKYPYLSPIYGDFSGLCPITIVTGTSDLIHLDSKKLREVLTKQNLPFNYFEYPDMFHDWIIFTFLPESKDAINRVCNVLRNT